MNTKLFFRLFFATFILLSLSNVAKAGDDWAQFDVYSKKNAQLEETIRPKAVFMGNSITEGWAKFHPEFFSSNNFIGRGISGQTTYQMLLRFRDDVINIQPEYVVILGGTNDIAENNHNYNEDRTFGNIVSMAELAEANGIKVILTSVLPAKSFPWRKAITDAPEKIKSLNERIEDYARQKNIAFVDYYPVMTLDGISLNPAYSEDGVHPNLKGYSQMEKLVVEALK